MSVANASDENHKDRFVLLTDKKSSSVVGLYHPPESTYNNASETLFEACLPRAVVRIDRGDIRPPWRRATPDGKVVGILADNIFGACTDGTIFALSILSQPARHLLRLTQNLIEIKRTRSILQQHDTVKVRSGDIFRILMNDTPVTPHGDLMIRDVDPRHWERASQRGPRHKHVDGDLLKQWLSEGGDLRSLVRDDVDAKIGRLFEELARDVCEGWGIAEVMGKGKGKNVDEDVFDQVKRWMQDVFMPML
jgi:hypothetical protein